MNEDRRTVLAAAAAAAFAAGTAAAQEGPGPPPGTPEGRPGDFDFLNGEWRIHRRWRSGPQSNEWLEFEGEAAVVGILGGICSVEELRIPARNFLGMGLRLLDQQTKVGKTIGSTSKAASSPRPANTAASSTASARGPQPGSKTAAP